MMTEKIINRPIYLKKLKSLQGKTDLVKIVTGVRRCGKSKLLLSFQMDLQFNSKVSDNQIININLENLLQTREIGLSYNDKGLLIGYEKLLDFIIVRLNPNVMTYLFIDEVQLLENWQRVVNALRLKGNIDIYLTGSNAYMFSSDLANSFGGRYIEIKIMPYSFKEYYNAYSQVGHIIASNNREEFLNTVQKDIIQRFNISNVAKLDSLTRFLFDNIGNETSVRGIERGLASINQNISAMTIDNYVQGLLDGYLLYKCDRYDIKGKKILTNTNSKYYAVDIGLRTALLGHEDADMGRILENIVYLELLRRGYKVYTGRISSRKNIEVDFVAQKPGEEVEYYQVALYALALEETLKRELASLEAIDDNYPKYLLTMDEGSGNSKGIKRINVLEWLINY